MPSTILASLCGREESGQLPAAAHAAGRRRPQWHRCGGALVSRGKRNLTLSHATLKIGTVSQRGGACRGQTIRTYKGLHGTPASSWHYPAIHTHLRGRPADCCESIAAFAPQSSISF